MPEDALVNTGFIQEIETPDGETKLRLQYVQVMQLDFFPRFDGGPGRIKWPHVSINTMEKVSDKVSTASRAADEPASRPAIRGGGR